MYTNRRAVRYRDSQLYTKGRIQLYTKYVFPNASVYKFDWEVYQIGVPSGVEIFSRMQGSDGIVVWQQPRSTPGWKEALLLIADPSTPL